ncbi:hydrolase [Dictyobacter alpinus]|uniref:Hydrolase n=1 Tax=Dictyobacter alpinus TaxID=2014873 RepID=A0A402BJT9_9CHLR|nr:alpha/beta hydrolase [Dictyobacter alpinus]GCE31622.1 hydrolase [Dictyobacter alpinus]
MSRATGQFYSGMADVNGTTIFYEIAGHGHPLVLIHSGYSNRKLWDDQFEELAQFYRVIRYDIRGYGDSAVVKTDTPLYTDWQDLYGLLQFLEIEHTHLLGLSGGAATALDFAINHPAMVGALVLVSPGVSGFDFGRWIHESPLQDQFVRLSEAFERMDIPQMIDLSLPLWAEGPARTPEQIDPLVREHIRAMCLQNWTRPNDPDAPPAQTIDPPAIARLAEIDIPTLIIVGDQDVAVILEIGEILTRQIKGAQKIVMSDVAHHLNMEKSVEFNQLVLEFLKKL